MSATQVTVTSTQVAVRYQRNVSSLSIDMLANCRTTALGRHIDRVSVEISADISVDFSVNMSTDTSQSIYRRTCRPTYQSSINQHLVDM